MKTLNICLFLSRELRFFYLDLDLNLLFGSKEHVGRAFIAFALFVLIVVVGCPGPGGQD